jgi:hypothetical protein
VTDPAEQHDVLEPFGFGELPWPFTRHTNLSPGHPCPSPIEETPLMNNRPFQFSLLAILVVITVLCFILASPSNTLSCAASLACLMLGVNCIRGALRNRISGWIAGLVFGSIITVIGLVACGLTLLFMAIPGLNGR